MTDTHCHLSFMQFDADREAARNRAAIVGVTRIVNPGTNLVQSRAAVELTASTAGSAPSVSEVFAAVGVHPQDVGKLTDDAFAEIARLAGHPKVVAVGEVGLEVSSRAGTLEQQKECLRRFLDLAEREGKPCLFHVRSAHGEFQHVLREYGRPVRGVVHCFSGTPDDARFCIARGLFLGIGGVVTFPNAAQLRTVVEDTPLEHLLLETDAPFLAPQSRRGKRNEPAYLPEIAEKIAELKGMTTAEVERATDENAERLFGL